MLILFCVVGYSSFSFFFFFIWDSEDLCVTCIPPDIHMTGFEAFPPPSGPHPSIVTFCMVWMVAAAADVCLSIFNFHFFRSLVYRPSHGSGLWPVTQPQAACLLAGRQ